MSKNSVLRKFLFHPYSLDWSEWILRSSLLRGEISPLGKESLPKSVCAAYFRLLLFSSHLPADFSRRKLFCMRGVIESTI